jgi:hypothetical protein
MSILDRLLEFKNEPLNIDRIYMVFNNYPIESDKNEFVIDDFIGIFWSRKKSQFDNIYTYEYIITNYKIIHFDTNYSIPTSFYCDKESAEDLIKSLQNNDCRIAFAKAKFGLKLTECETPNLASMLPSRMKSAN